MVAPNTAEKVWRGTPSQSAQVPYSRVSLTKTSPTSKTTARITLPIYELAGGGWEAWASEAKIPRIQDSRARSDEAVLRPCREFSTWAQDLPLSAGRGAQGALR